MIIGFGAAFEKSVLDRMELGSYVVVGWGSQAFWVLILAGIYRKQVTEFFFAGGGMVKESFVFAFTGVTKSIFFLAALSIANASIVVPATNFITVIVVAASYVILKEHDHIVQKLIAVLIGVTGLILLGISS